MGSASYTQENLEPGLIEFARRFYGAVSEKAASFLESLRSNAAKAFPSLLLSKEPSHDLLRELTRKELEQFTLRLWDEAIKLNQRLNKNSSNSSNPPSQDLHKTKKPSPPDAPAAETGGDAPKPNESAESVPSEKKTKRGGKPNHPGKTRLTFDRIDRVVPVTVQQCPHCNGAVEELSEPLTRKRQVADLPEMPVIVTEYQMNAAHCPCCQATVWPEEPEEILGGQLYGPRLQSLLVYLKVNGPLSSAKVLELVHNVFQIPMSDGTLDNILSRMEKAVQPELEQLKADLLGMSVEEAAIHREKPAGETVEAAFDHTDAPFVHADETGWPVGGRRGILWGFSNENTVYYHYGTRARSEIEKVLGQSFPGTVVSDYYSAYQGYPTLAKQYCFAHLLREFQALADGVNALGQLFGQDLIRMIQKLYDLRRLWKTGELGEIQWREETLRVQIEMVNRVDEADHGAASEDAVRLAKRLKKEWPHYWTFASDGRIAPDNNAQERLMRPVVVLRKLTGGSKSKQGADRTTALLSVIQTCRLRGMVPYQKLQDILIRHFRSYLRQPVFS